MSTGQRRFCCRALRDYTHSSLYSNIPGFNLCRAAVEGHEFIVDGLKTCLCNMSISLCSATVHVGDRVSQLGARHRTGRTVNPSDPTRGRRTGSSAAAARRGVPAATAAADLQVPIGRLSSAFPGDDGTHAAIHGARARISNVLSNAVTRVARYS